MSHCIVCGRKLKRSTGPVGPTCLKRQGNSESGKKITHKKSDRCKFVSRHDIFEEEENGQKAV